ncbi:hypothetical protein MJT46_010572 [Ovis ammon polii x Ovis aries]|nr:hypothetical protein MJT46_010572 [Ovis ammon polii x Ovis aries]
MLQFLRRKLDIRYCVHVYNFVIRGMWFHSLVYSPTRFETDKKTVMTYYGCNITYSLVVENFIKVELCTQLEVPPALKQRAPLHKGGDCFPAAAVTGASILICSPSLNSPLRFRNKQCNLRHQRHRRDLAFRSFQTSLHIEFPRTLFNYLEQLSMKNTILNVFSYKLICFEKDLAECKVASMANDDRN